MLSLYIRCLTLFACLGLLLIGCDTSNPESPLASDQPQSNAPDQTPTSIKSATTIAAQPTNQVSNMSTSVASTTIPTITVPNYPTPVQPDAQGVGEIQPVATMSDEVVSFLLYFPPEGGVTGCLTAGFSPQGKPLFGVDMDSLTYGQTVGVCYTDFPSGTVSEQVVDPSGKVVSNYTFEIDASKSLNVYASDFTPLPKDMKGEYTIRSKTPLGDRTTTFNVVDFDPETVNFNGAASNKRAFHVIDVDKDRVELQPTYLLAYNFEPREQVPTLFYEPCIYSGWRRQGLYGSQYITSGLIQVNERGFAFVPITGTLQTLLAGRAFDVVGRSLPGDASAGQNAGIYDASNAGGSVKFEAVEPGLFDYSYNDRKICSAPAAAKISTSSTANKQAELIRSFELGAKFTQIYAHHQFNLEVADSTLFVGIDDGELIDMDVKAPDTSYAWDITTGKNVRAYTLPFFPQGVIKVVAQDITYEFLADNKRYLAITKKSDVDTISNELFLVNPNTKALERVFSTEQSWATWLVAKPTMFGEVRSPAITVAGNMAIFAQPGYIVATDINNKQVRWQVPLPRDVSAPPAATSSTVYVPSYDGYLYALDILTGKERWKFPVGDWVNKPVVSSSSVYVRGDNNYLFALDADSGTEQWRYTPTHPNEMFVSDPVIDGQFVFIGVNKYNYLGSGTFDGVTSSLAVYELSTDTSNTGRVTPEIGRGTVVADDTTTTTSTVKYRTADPEDHYVTVRGEATTSSAEIQRLPANQQVVCERIVSGEELLYQDKASSDWTYCPNVGGYIFLPLLIPEQ